MAKWLVRRNWNPEVTGKLKLKFIGLLGKWISIFFLPCMTKAVLSRGFTLPSFLKTNECFFPLKSMQYPSIKSAISSALASEKVVNTRGWKENDEIRTHVSELLFLLIKLCTSANQWAKKVMLIPHSLWTQTYFYLLLVIFGADKQQLEIRLCSETRHPEARGFSSQASRNYLSLAH